MWEANKLKLSVQKILLEGETNETEAACLLFTMQKLSEQSFYKQARTDYPMIKVSFFFSFFFCFKYTVWKVKVIDSTDSFR
jgi:hypothetical protein